MSVVPASPCPDGGPDVPRLLEAVRSIGSGLELHSTLDRICEKAAELADARYAAIGVAAEDGEGLADFVFHGVDEETARRIGQLPDGHKGLLGALIHDPTPVRLAQLDEDARSCGFPEHHPAMRSFLGVPIRVRGEIFGNLYLAEKRGGGPFGDDDLDMVCVLAAEAGIAIGNARLYEAARQRERWIDGSVAVTRALLSADDAEDALQVVAEQARGSRARPPGSCCCPPRRAAWRSARSPRTARPRCSEPSSRRRANWSPNSSPERPCSSTTRPPIRVCPPTSPVSTGRP